MDETRQSLERIKNDPLDQQIFVELFCFPPDHVEALCQDGIIGEGCRQGFLMREHVPNEANEADVLRVAKLILSKEFSREHRLFHSEACSFWVRQRMYEADMSVGPIPVEQAVKARVKLEEMNAVDPPCELCVTCRMVAREAASDPVLN
jgi:hypothetical protein